MNRVRNVLLFLLVVACGASFWSARRGGTAPAIEAVAPAEETPSGPPATAESIHVAVLNGTGEPGLARRVSRLLPTLGCVVVSVGDAPADTFPRTLLVNRRLDGARLDWLAKRLASPAVVLEWDARCDEDVVLVLGRDHEAVLAAVRAGR